MTEPRRQMIEQAAYAASGETHRIMHVETVRGSFYEILMHAPGQGHGNDPDWTRFGATARSLEEARTASRLRDLHVVERRDMPRDVTHYADGDPSAPRTKWGQSQCAERYAAGIVFHGTAGHGGFKLDTRRNAKVDPAWRIAGGWYEEDNDWAIVAHTFPEAFTTLERRNADRILRDLYPDQYMRITGDVLNVSESETLQNRAFAEAAKDKWVVVSAITSKEDRGMVVAKATLGGKRPGYGEEWDDRTFLVPADEYEGRSRHGFVIDLARHEELQPSAPEFGM